MTMFTLREAAALIPGAVLQGDENLAIERIVTDSRAVQAGDLFVAVKGDRFDAHDFLDQVAKGGASAALVSREPSSGNAWPLPVIKVKDTRIGLGALAHGWRERFAMPLVAVTGSNGKTTVKEMISSIFAAAVGEDARLATAGNFNNDIGLPLTLFRLNAAHKLAVVELGMNHPGETSVLGKIAAPTVAVVNNAQREHQEFMATVEAVALEHASVIHALGETGTAVFPADDHYASIWRVAATGNPIMDFALSEDAAKAAVTGTLDGTTVHVRSPQGEIDIALAVLGDHNARNALAATAAALAAGVSLDAVKRGLEAFQPVKGRLQVKRAVLGALSGATVIDDTYNSNPDSMRAAIDVLASQASPRVLVMGDMGEVGEEGPAFHREVGAYAAQRGIDALFALGDASVDSVNAFNAAASKQAGAHFNDVAALIQAVQQAGFGPGATYLAKGSRFMKMERVVDAVTSPQPPVAGTTPAAH
ncbi:UDP-N-acetylmuramoyl-tripeptide--D-alanyl-D-alanine ligase [Caballeronia sp. LP006]|uniref:UDP-N-acetylmuramoyl-tripeptide--D-alanyl-D- alanine ligase n=1 Tax=unclassified Caballeronia TaxID=2646786 RepID=UPI001FD1288F|nr:MULTISPECIES: UDP-N-acetylmuramoyl-tripeptide--D-alanyl-D-alanine ligase [unclassified Caballeronia]MDR5772592.1 UDP-N-acetylmuramoyl-tripeptide--D-alanyl-D-alanine ligase [Caballeronia sp. LZ002]MDR5803976.1 UDP-N-acetylmuramoyl-tripeptide--D-alanyl-D-alanine ligase [Caballeronia sp. LZ001]MDR5832190.1 UDP-N-acetylmuramoyl-tripeptide--D-alanyl-D-alanine ligase [Caballeronia sp. LP006]MDR5848026.1 UDP-N-acetylmuramoyl-tripeptide--D-alanyl-D-alanine ligase [Caballeronia sp. LZ003]